MKCAACEYEKDVNNEYVEIDKRDEEFIGLLPNIFRREGGVYCPPVDVSLYICPKCGTVRAE